MRRWLIVGAVIVVVVVGYLLLREAFGPEPAAYTVRPCPPQQVACA